VALEVRLASERLYHYDSNQDNLGPRERHLESLVHRTLRSLILTHAYPRCLIQLTLQILRTPSASSSSAPTPQTASHLPPLPALLHTGILALLNGNIPLKGTATSVLVAVGGGAGKSGDAIVIDSGEKDVKLANSLHVFAWTSQGEFLLAESEGVFGMDEWEEAAEAAKKVCKGSEAGGDVDMVGSGETGGLDGWLRRNVGAEMARTTRWKGEV
jgi:exosome complex component RRP46